MKHTFKKLIIAMLVLCTFVGVLPMIAADDITAQAAAVTVYYDFKKGHPGTIPSTVTEMRAVFSGLSYSVVAGRNPDITSGEWAYSSFSATGTSNASTYASYVSTATGYRGIAITSADRDNVIKTRIKFKVPNGGKYVPYLNVDGDSYPDYAGIITARIYNGSTVMYEKEIFLASYPADENYIRLGDSQSFTAGGEYILEIEINKVRTYALLNGLRLSQADSTYISAIDPTNNLGVYEVKVGESITIPYTQLMSDGTVSTSTQSGWQNPLINDTTEKENSYLKAEVVSGSRYYRITGKAATSTPQTIEFKNINGCAPTTRINVIVRAANYSNTDTNFYYDFEKALPTNVSAEQVYTIGKHVTYGNTAVGGYGEVKKSLSSYPWKISSIASTVDFSPIYQGYGIQNKRKGIAEVKIQVPVAGTYMPQLYLHNTSSTPGIQSNVTISILNSAETTTYSSVTLEAGTSSDVVNLSRHGISLSAGEYIVRFNKTADHASDPNLGANYYNGINLNKTSTTTVTLNPNGGTANSTTQVILTKGYAPPSIDDGKTVPTRTGYRFGGFYDTTDTSGTQWYNKDGKGQYTWNSSASTDIFYAFWNVNTYHLVFNANGGSGSMSKQSINYDVSANITANAFTRTGYTFKNWNTKSDGSGTTYANKASVKNLSDTNQKEINLYAQWTANTYTVAYNANGGTGTTMTSSSHTYNTAKTLTANTYTKTGYTFNGWNTKSDGSGTSYADKASVKNLSSTNGATVTLYAQWKANTYTVAYNGNGNTGGSTASSTHTYDASKALTANGFTKTGYTFNGWNTKSDGSGTSYADKASVKNLATSGTVTLYAQWELVNYTITYNLNSGTQGSGAVTGYNVTTATFNLPTPTRTGYTFGGWYTASNFSGTAVTQIAKGSTGDKTFYAKWTANTYEVTLNADGGTGGTASVTATYGSAMPAITKPTRDGYTFGGYYTAENGGGTQYYTAAGASARNWNKTAATTLYAKWTANTYTVTLDGQNATSAGTTSVTATYGSAMPAITKPTRTGYTFGGYYTSTGGSGTQYYKADGSSTRAWNKTSATTLYAKWTAKTYTVTFDANGGGTPSPATMDVTYDSTYGTLATVSRTGYTFAGWYTAASGGTKVTSSTKVTITAAQTLYAHWTANTYSVKYNANGGSGTMSNSSHTYGTAKALTANAFTKTGYTFKGWDTDSAGTTVVHTDKKSVSNLTSTSGGTVNLYAVWEANTYSVKYNANGGSGTMSDSSHTYGTAKALTANAFTKTGYTFQGWDTSSAGTTVVHTDKKSVSNLTSTNGATVNLYAVWKANEYTVAYDANGGSGTTASSSHTYDTAKALTANGFSRSGYTFNGWNTEANGSGTAYANSASVKNLATSGTVTLYAQWKLVNYTITYNLNSGTQGSGAVTGYNVTTATFNLPTPTRTGYTFGGWYTASNFSGTAVTQIAKGSTGDKTFYAKWTANTYTITLDDGTSTTTITATYGSLMPEITKPQAAGKVFGGYWTEENGGGEKYYTTTGTSSRNWNIAEDTTLYAHWTAATVTLTNPGDKSVTAENQLTFSISGSTNSGMGVTYSATNLPSGATFSGDTFTWTPTIGQIGTYDVTFKAVDGDRSASRTITITVNAPQFTVSLSEGGTVEVTYGVAMPEITAPTKTGFVFAGYFDGENGTGTQYYNADGTSARNWNKTEAVTLYAKWVQGEVTITQIGDKTVAVEEELTFNVEATTTAPDDITYTAENLPDGAIFNETTGEFSWTPTTEQVGEYTIIFRGSDGVNYAEVTVKVVVTEILSTITLDDGTNTTEIRVIYDEELPAITAPVKEGFMFDGYFDGENGTGTKYYNIDGTPARTWDKKETSVTLYAKWIEGDERLGRNLGVIRNKLITDAEGNERLELDLLAGVDSLKYNEIGFEVTIDGVTVRQGTHFVYQTIKDSKKTYTPADFGSLCKHAFIVRFNFPTSYKAKSVTLRPYAIDFEGNTIYGKQVTVPGIHTKL